MKNPNSSMSADERKYAALVWLLNLIFLGAGNVYAVGSERVKVLLFGLLWQYIVCPNMPLGFGFVLWLLVYLFLGVDGYLEVRRWNDKVSNKLLMGLTGLSRQDREIRSVSSNLSPYASANFEAKLKSARTRVSEPVESQDFAEQAADIAVSVATSGEDVAGYQNALIDTSNEAFKFEPLAYDYGSQTNTGDNSTALSLDMKVVTLLPANAEPCTNCSSPRTSDFAFCLNCGHSYGLG